MSQTKPPSQPPSAHHIAQPNPISRSMIIGMIGGPGAGKGTQCSLLQQKFNFSHLSIGEILRAKSQRLGSPFADEITQNQMLGRVGRAELTVALLRDRIEQAVRMGSFRIILDGFPRNTEQAEYFSTTVKPLTLVILLDCTPEVLLSRLVNSNRDRADDNPDTISKRLATFSDSTANVIAAYESKAALERIDAEQGIEDVFADVQDGLRKRGIMASE